MSGPVNVRNCAWSCRRCRNRRRALPSPPPPLCPLSLSPRERGRAVRGPSRLSSVDCPALTSVSWFPSLLHSVWCVWTCPTGATRMRGHVCVRNQAAEAVHVRTLRAHTCSHSVGKPLTGDPQRCPRPAGSHCEGRYAVCVSRAPATARDLPFTEAAGPASRRLWSCHTYRHSVCDHCSREDLKHRHYLSLSHCL